MRRLAALLWLLLAAWGIPLSPARASEVTIDTQYPSAGGEHARASSSRGVRVENPFNPNTATVAVNGNVDVSGGAVLTGKAISVAFNAGPWGNTGFNINPAGQVAIGNNAPGRALLTAHTRIKTHNYYASEQDLTTGDVVYAYGESRADISAPLTDDRGKAAFFGARRHGIANQPSEIDLFAPLQIEGSQVFLGLLPDNPPPGVAPQLPATFGQVTWVGIGMDRLEEHGEINPLPPADSNCLLEVNGPVAHRGFHNYSSRTFKADIIPVGAPERSRLLSQVRSTPLYRYRYKDAPKIEHLGPVAEESPRSILSADGMHLSLTDTLGVLSAALQELQAEQARLTARLEELEIKRRDRAS